MLQKTEFTEYVRASSEIDGPERALRVEVVHALAVDRAVARDREGRLGRVLLRLERGGRRDHLEGRARDVQPRAGAVQERRRRRAVGRDLAIASKSFSTRFGSKLGEDGHDEHLPRAWDRARRRRRTGSRAAPSATCCASRSRVVTTLFPWTACRAARRAPCRGRSRGSRSTRSGSRSASARARSASARRSSSRRRGRRAGLADSGGRRASCRRRRARGSARAACAAANEKMSPRSIENSATRLIALSCRSARPLPPRSASRWS